MGQIDKTIRHVKRLESRLADLGATGRGLHEKTSSIASDLPEDLVRRLRFIATVRNKLVHDADYDRLDDPRGYFKACRQAEKQLNQLSRKGGGGWMWRVIWLVIIVVLIGLALIGAGWVVTSRLA